MLAVGDKLIVTQSYGMQGAEKSIDWAVALAGNRLCAMVMADSRRRYP